MVTSITFKPRTLYLSGLTIIVCLICFYTLKTLYFLSTFNNHTNNHFKTYNDFNPNHFFRNKTKITFVTSYYRATTTTSTNNNNNNNNRQQQQIPDTSRQSELDICLASVVGNPILDSVHILGFPIDLSQLPDFVQNTMIGGFHEPFGGEERWDNSPTVHQKVVLVEKNNRPMMGTFFEYICELDQKQQQQQEQGEEKEEDNNRLVMFSNADILFDTSLEYFMRLSALESQSRFYALSRWVMTKDRGLSPESYIGFGSYDTFVFSPESICRDSKQKWKELVRELNYPMGRLGAENRLLFEIKRLFPELKLINPARTVKTVHLHQSPNRSGGWGDRVNLDGRTAWIEGEDVV